MPKTNGAGMSRASALAELARANGRLGHVLEAIDAVVETAQAPQ